LIWKLSNGKVHSTDVTNASRTLMMNLTSLNWDEEILETCNIPIRMLPSIKSSISKFGYIEAIEELIDIPINAVLGENENN